MFLLVILSMGGLLAGLLLLRRVPLVNAHPAKPTCQLKVGVIIPARNEESNLPLLLESLQMSEIGPSQVLVVDDGSTDNTPAIALRYGATVIPSRLLPVGWTGKTWACHQGALASTGEVLFFLDADTRFVRGGYLHIVNCFATLPQNTILSLLPFHRKQCWYEELSMFFNIVVAMGAGGFGGLDTPHMFGQAMLIRRDLYQKAGGHECVKREILENLHLAAHVSAAGGSICARGGRGTLEMRMFPHGLGQLRESWQKAFAAGAVVTSPLVLGLSIFWLTAAMLTALMLFATKSHLWLAAVTLYMLNVAQIAWYGRQLGTFRWATALLYPAPLAFYFATFAQSMWLRRRGQQVTWRGRQL